MSSLGAVGFLFLAFPTSEQSSDEREMLDFSCFKLGIASMFKVVCYFPVLLNYCCLIA